jgi:beta-galactosidase/beta-glucuronidase
MTEDFEYPRPQMRRQRWTSLNGPWRFAFDPDARHELPADVREWPLVIEVPFAPESARSGIADTGFHKACWYSREFDVPDLDAIRRRGDRVLLHFGAVDYQARVWLNDVVVAEHEGGHTPFSRDVTRHLQASPQRLVVRAEDDPLDLEKPRGKQDWRLEPHSIWYPRTTGIWQTVWFEVVGKTYIESFRFTPNLERWEIAMHVFLEGDHSNDLALRIRLRCGNQLLAEDTCRVLNREVHRKIGLSDPGIDDYRNDLLWSPECPTLLEVDLTLLDGSQVLDEVASYTALRSIGTQREKLVLNGRYYNLRLVLDQGYWPDTLMTPPSGEALRRDVELAKAMGFNGVRKHQKIEDPRYLYWADVLGLLVWEEMPSQYRFTPKAVERMIREWSEAIRRDRSHPCIIVWVPFNESWGVPDLTLVAAARDAVAALYHLTKTLDPHRLVVGNDGWESSATDLIGIHDYDGEPAHLRARYGPEVKPGEVVDRRWSGGRILTLDGYPHRGQPICLTEFGGVSRATDQMAQTGDWGYVRRSDPEEFASLCCELIEVARTTAMFSGFCYTQFADTFQETNGLLTADRRPKIPLERLALAVRGRPPPQPPT